MPHTEKAGDPYYIGDIYHRLNAVKYGGSDDPYPLPEGTKENHPELDARHFKARLDGTYYNRVRNLARVYPDLGYLAQWMEYGTSPIKMKDVSLANRDRRVQKVNVTIVDVEEGIEQSPRLQLIEVTSVQDLRKNFGGKDGDENDKVKNRLIIVEDLSREVIETLGSRFDIDPLFFRSQLSDYKYYNGRDPWFEASEMDMITRNRPFFHIDYLRPRYFQKQEHLREARNEAGLFNVLRRLDVMGGFTKELDEPNSEVALIRNKLSLWVRPGQSTQWLGILLVDPPITSGFELWGGIRNFHSSASVASDVIEAPPRDSLLEHFKYWIRSSVTETPESGQSDFPNLGEVVMKEIFTLVCSEWLRVTSHATTRLSMLEWEVEGPDWLAKDKDDRRESTLKKLHPWRRMLPFFHRDVSASTDLILKRPTLLNIPEDRLKKLAADMQPDLDAIQADMKRLIKQSQVLQSFITASISYDESKRATQQNIALSRLAWVALVFAPLQFFSGLFSVQSDLGELKDTIWWYCKLAFPITFVLLLVVARAHDMKKIGRWIWDKISQKDMIKASGRT